MPVISCSFLELLFSTFFRMNVKVTHKKCFATQTARVLKKVGKLRICSFCWMQGGRYRTSWLVACCMLESAERFQSRGAEQERTKW